jgi:hypothetical protein
MARDENPPRDNFTAPTKMVIAQRVGYHCSRCGCGTVGPNEDPARTSSIGVAAHITAASAGGPRFDASLSSDERRDARNGIWCCQNCAKLIDNDVARYPVKELIRLREAAERAAADRLEAIKGQPTAFTHADTAVRAAAEVMLRGWREIFGFDEARLVELDLREFCRDTDPAGLSGWTLAQLADGLKQSRILILRGEPGAGKTVTLVQLARRMMADASLPIPLLFPVSGWINSGHDLVAYATDQLASRGIPAADVALLLRAGRVALLLNGWNEAEEDGLARAEIQLRGFLRHHPGTPLLLSTRVTHATPALAGETSIDVQRLTSAKKAAIVRASGVANAERLIAQIEGSATLTDITDTPLFLAATIQLARAGGEIPTTRAHLLLRCVEALEGSDEHRAQLRTAPCHGCHRRLLADLAAAMTRRGRTTLSTAEAEDVIAASTRRLAASGHLAESGHVPAILATLVRHHMLVLPPEGAGTYAFSHEQFQERFSADWLLARLRELTAVNSPADILAFQQEILNSPHWRVPLVFAMEDLAGDDPAHGAKLVRWMMSVDLVAAAELAGAGGAPVWAIVGGELGAQLRRWHARQAGPHRACATAAMVATGSADFADLLWPMLEGTDDQDVFRLLRAWDSFELAILGPGWAERVARLPALRQEIIIAELMRHPSRDNLAFIRALAVNGISSGVKHEALEALIFQRRFAEALAAMGAATFGPWRAETYILLTRMPPVLVAPLAPRLAAALAQETDLPIRHGIIAALLWANGPGWLDAAKRELSAALAARRQVPPWENALQHASNGQLRTQLDMLIAEYAGMIGAANEAWLHVWLAGDEAGDLIWERSFIGHLPRLPEDVQVRLTQSTLQRPPTGYASNSRIKAVAESGSPRVAGVVLEAYLATGDTADRRHDLRSLLGELPVTALIAAIVARAATATDFNTRFALVNALSFGREPVKPVLTAEQRATLRQLARATAESIPAGIRGRPSIHADLAQFLGRIGTAEDIPLITTWAQEEVARWDAIRAAHAMAQAGGARRAMDQDGSWWGHYYVECLVALGGPEAEAVLRDWLSRGEFSHDAANGLVQLCRQEGLLPPAPPLHLRSTAIGQTTPFVPSAAVRSRADAIYAARDQPEGRPGFDPKRLGVSLALLNDSRALELLLARPTRHSGHLVGDALHLLATFGTTLPGRAVADALEPFIAANEDPHRQNGHDPWHAIVKALAVMLASDTPGLAIERMRRLPAGRREGLGGRELFAVLASSPKPEAGAYLVELSRSLPAAAHSWPELIEALGDSDHPDCRARLLELGVSPAPGAAPLHGDALQREFVRAAQSDPKFAAALVAQLHAMDSPARAIFVHTMGELASEAAMLALLDWEDLQPVAEILEGMVRGVTLGEMPSDHDGMRYLVPRSANGIRRKLALLLVAESRSNRAVAARLLAAIQMHRLEYGQPMDEPLHPYALLIPQLGGPWSLME